MPVGALASLALCALLPAVGTSIANVALPTLAEAFAAPFHRVQWVVLAYLLALTASIVGVGRLGDRMGRRRLLAAGLAVFVASSALAGVAPALGLLVAARAAQGVGAAVLMALAVAMVGETVPKQRTGRAMGLLGAASALGTALGPSLGGMLVAAIGWPAVFLVNVPLGALALVLVLRHLPADRRAPQAPRTGFDTAGAVLLAATIAAYALAMTLQPGRLGAPGVALLLLAGLGAALFVRVETKAASPLVRVAALRDPRLGGGLATSALVSTVVMATLMVGPFHLAYGLGADTARVGLAMSAGPLAAALAGWPAGRLVDRLGAAPTVLAGLAGMGGASAALCIVPAGWGVAGYVLPLVALTASYALFQAANNTAVMRHVAAGERGAVSGLLALSRNLGLVTGASVMGSVFAFASGSADFATARPEAVIAGMRWTFAVATALLAVALAIAAASRARAR